MMKEDPKDREVDQVPDRDPEDQEVEVDRDQGPEGREVGQDPGPDLLQEDTSIPIGEDLQGATMRLDF